MDWQQDQAIPVNNIQLGMIRIIDRIHPDPFASKNNVGKLLNDQLSKQLTPDPKMLMTNNIGLPPSKPVETSLIEVPKKWADFLQMMINSPTQRSWMSGLLQSQFPSIILQPGEVSTINLSSAQLSEQCERLDSIHSSV